MVGMAQILFGDDLEQSLFHLKGGFSRGQPDTVSQTEKVGIHGDGRFIENDIQNHIGGLASHAGEGLEGFALCRNFAAMILNKNS